MSFFRVDNTCIFTKDFEHRKFMGIINELFLNEGTGWYHMMSYLDAKYDAEIYNSGGNIMLCGIRLGGPFWLSISDESYVLFNSAKNNKRLFEIEYDESSLILQGDYHDS